MAIPKKKYRDKVRARLATVQAMFADKERIDKMMRRVYGLQDAQKSTEFHNRMQTLDMLLGTDVPALLDCLDDMQKEQADGE